MNGRLPKARRSRVHDQRALGQDQIALAEAEAVDVGRPRGRVPSQDPRRRLGVLDEEAVLAAGREAHHVVDGLAPRAVEVRVRRGVVSRGGRRLDAQRLQHLRIERDRHRSLGHRHVDVAQTRDVDVRVVPECRSGSKGGLHPLEQSAAGIGGELLVGDPPFLGGRPVGGGVQEPRGVRGSPVAEREPVQHRQSVEPVAHPLLAHLELGGPGANQGPRQPGRQRPRHRQVVEHDLALERVEAPAEARGRGGGARGHPVFLLL